MVRKRSKFTRDVAKRKRPKTAAPTNGWLIAELASLSGLPVSKLRYYLTQGLIKPIQFRGNLTRYRRRELLRLLALRRVKSDALAVGKSGLTLAQLKKRLDALSEAELESWLLTGPLSAEAVAALGLQSRLAETAEPKRSPLPPGEAWQHFALLPGLELKLRADASEAVRGFAERMIADTLRAIEASKN